MFHVQAARASAPIGRMSACFWADRRLWVGCCRSLTLDGPRPASPSRPWTDTHVPFAVASRLTLSRYSRNPPHGLGAWPGNELAIWKVAPGRRQRRLISSQNRRGYRSLARIQFEGNARRFAGCSTLATWTNTSHQPSVHRPNASARRTALSGQGRGRRLPVDQRLDLRKAAARRRDFSAATSPKRKPQRLLGSGIAWLGRFPANRRPTTAGQH